MPFLGFSAVRGTASPRSWPLLIAATALAWCAAATSLTAQTIVPRGAEWRYLADGSNQGTNWRGAAFEDLAWPVGPAPLGFGEDGLATVITTGIGPTTTYFRHTFTIADWRAFRTLTVRVRRDDGVIVYLNNRVIVRDNLPTGVVSNLTPAMASVVGNDESRLFQFGTAAHWLLNGTNVLAVELHQSVSGWLDGSFDLELLGNLPLAPPTVSLITPEDGAVVPAGAVLLRADARDVDGHIALVEFYANGLLIGTDSTEPFEFSWQNAPIGRHIVWANAVDYSGRRAESPTARVQVGTVAVDRALRGPYLQSGSSTSVVVRWRTDWFTQGRVLHGTDPENLDLVAQNTNLTTEHAVQLTGLQPHTKYFYAIGTASQSLAGGGDYWFTTAPTNSQRTRVWAIGDSGTANLNQAMVRDAFLEHTSSGLASVWLMLGDNAYECGTDVEYQAAVFNVYPEILRRVPLWPTIGNHDAGCYSDLNQFPYLDIFHLPAQGEAGGVASGTEKYYSFDHGNIHFVCLDSQTSSRLSGSAMLVWLEQDLAATDKDWIIAYWHHPPYSFGTHNSDLEYDLTEMRQYVAPVLESHGVDLVLCGHSHNYERSYLLTGHYGFSSDFSTANVLNSGFGRDDEDGAYQKPAGGIGANLGTVYTVCGCSGEGGYFQPQFHPAMRVSLTGFGSMILDIDGLRLDAKFLTETGSIADYFTIRKGMPPADMRPGLSLHRSGNRATITWPTSLRPFQLEAAERLDPQESWRAVPETPLRHGRKEAVTVDLVRSNEVFRLKAEP
jgi:hypothetical protein